MTTSLWKFLNTDINELFSLDTIDEAVDTVGTLQDLAETLGDEDIQAIAPWVEKSASLLDVLNTPEAELVGSILPFAKIATGLLKFYLAKSKKDLTFSDCVVLVGLKAYSESLKGFLVEFEGQDPPLPPLKRGEPDSNTEVPFSKGDLGGSTQNLEQFNTLKTFELNDTDANKTLLCFHQSKLAQHLKTLMAERLQQAGIDTATAQRLTERAAWNTHRYITQAWSELPDDVRRFNVGTLADWRAEQEKYDSIDTYLEQRIQPLPNEQVFDEVNPRVTFRDIYVSLDVQPLDQGGAISPSKKPINIHNWALGILQSSESPRKVMFLEGEAGRGKSVFCRMFADWVKLNLYPVFTPIVVRLRNLRILANNLTETLEDCPDLETVGFVRRDRGWLSDENVRFLIILDGFDELLLQDRPIGGLKKFLHYVADFQIHSHHQCIVTGRPLALQGVNQLITQTHNLERVQLKLMNDELRNHWLTNWQIIFGEDEVNQFRSFISACPDEIANQIAREPLLIYLLARLHRERHLTVDMFAATQNNQDQRVQAKMRIYRESVNWVLEKQRQNENLRLTGLDDLDDLREVLREAALCVVQSGNETAKIIMLKDRFQDPANLIAAFLNQAQQTTGQSEDKTLNNLLTTFYLKPNEGDKRGSVEFAHKSFGEYLFAERLNDAFETWIKTDKRGRQFKTENSDLHWQIYDLLGYGELSIEIVEYVFELLNESDLDRIKLFQRLEEFYFLWCEGEFINQSQDKNWPQQKMLQLQVLDIPIGLKTVDVYAGLNVLILLFKLHADAQPLNYPTVPADALTANISFHPCGKPDTNEFKAERLLNVIHYADSLGIGTFTKTVGPHLSRANLSRANNYGADLSRADFSRANLANATFDSANLVSADLSRANLSNATFESADLSGANLDSTILDRAIFDRANLSNANLSSAIFERAFLSNANLSNANLSNANLSNTNLSNANFSFSTPDRAILDSATSNRDIFYYYANKLYYANNLSNANLSNANLSNANISNANISSTNLDGIRWNKHTDWTGVSGIETAENVPEALKEQLGISKQDEETE